MAASTSVGDLCRLCGTDTLNIVRNAIFEGEGRVKKYALKISECLTLQVTQEDRLPKIMCGECTYKLDLISDFRDKAFKTETLLISKLDLDVVKPEIPDEDDGPDLNNDDVGGDDFHSSSPEPPIEPEVVVKEEDHAVEKRPGRKAATKRSMRESESEEEEEEAPAKKRGRKPKETPTATATAPVAAPPKENTGEVERSSPQAPLTPPIMLNPSGFKCTVKGCTFSAYSAKVLSIHQLKSHSVLSYSCSPCHRNFRSDALLQQHLQINHPLHTPEPEQCGECTKRFANAVTLKNHMMSHTGVYEFKCPKCGAGAATFSAFQKHMQTHNLNRCDKCNYSSNTAGALKTHKSRHHRPTPPAVNCQIKVEELVIE